MNDKIIKQCNHRRVISIITTRSFIFIPLESVVHTSLQIYTQNLVIYSSFFFMHFNPPPIYLMSILRQNHAKDWKLCELCTF